MPYQILKDLNILYIEDEKNIRENITEILKMLCKNVYAFEKAPEISNLFKTHSINIIITDINLPGKNGIEFIKEIRKIDSKIPIIILTAHLDTKYLLESTRLKLVDYLVKPINFDKLNSALSRATQEILENSLYTISFKNDTVYNIQEKKLYFQKEKIPLTSKEIELLEYFIKNRNKIVSHDEIEINVWQNNFEVTESAFKTLLNKLRHKIGKESIENISGIGYKLIIK